MSSRAVGGNEGVWVKGGVGVTVAEFLIELVRTMMEVCLIYPIDREEIEACLEVWFLLWRGVQNFKDEY